MFSRQCTYLRACHGARQPATQLAARRLVVVRAAAGSGGDQLDEPGIGRKDLGIVFSQQNSNVADRVAFPATVPLLPFPVEEVLLPGSVKTLHLFEARYLSLLDEVLSSPNSNKVFGHVVIEQLGDPVGSKASAFPGAYVGQNFVFLMGTMCRVLEVKNARIGALVKIQAEARIAVKAVDQVQPYIRGTVVRLPDEPLQDRQQVHEQLQQLVSTMQDIQNLTMKFKTNQTAAIQQAMYWWEKLPLITAAAGDDLATFGTTSSGESSSSSSSSSSGESGSSSAAGSISNSKLQDQSDPQPATAAEESSSSSSSSRAEVDLAERAARLSFAALQCVPEASPMEQLKLLRCCVNALETNDTGKRLDMVQKHMQETFKLLAAKCALKSLQLN